MDELKPVDAEVGVRLRAQLLGDLHHGREDGRPPAVRVAEELGAQPYDHGAVGRLRPPRCARQLEPVGTDLDFVAVETASHEVHRRAADEAGDEGFGRVVVELLRRRHLLYDALVQHRHALADGHCLGLVVRDVDSGDS